jgi:hypothetical protein
MHSISRIPLAILFLFLSLFYYASHFPIAASNEGSHYALVQSLAEEGSFVTNTYFKYHMQNDFAYRDGHFYADRAPGTALVSVPFYYLGKLYASKIKNEYEKETRIKNVVLFGPAIFGAGTVILLILSLRQLGISERNSWISGLLFAFASQHWKFSSHLFAHVYLSAAVVLTWYLLIKDSTGEPSTWGRRWFYLSLGVLPYFGYESLVIWPVFLIGRYVFIKPYLKHSFLKRIVTHIDSGIWFSVPILFLMVIHWICWGTPFKTFGEFQNPYHWGNTSLSTFFNTPLFIGLYIRLFNFPHEQYDCPIGLFALHPMLFVGLLGYVYFFRLKPREASIQFLLTLSLILFFAKMWDWCGGSSGDPRYLLPVLWSFFLPFAFLLEHGFKKISSESLKAVYQISMGLLCGIAFFICFVHFSRFHGHDFDIKTIKHYSPISAEAFVGILSKVFVSFNEVYLLAYFQIAVLLILAVVGLLKPIFLKIKTSKSGGLNHG